MTFPNLGFKHDPNLEVLWSLLQIPLRNLIIGISHTTPTYGLEKPTPTEIPALIDSLERGNNYDWRCINGDLYVDHGGNVYTISVKSEDGRKWPIVERINYVERMANGTLKTISEPTVTLPDEIEYHLDIVQASPNFCYLLVNGTYLDENGKPIPLSPNYLYYDEKGRAKVQMVEQETDGLACKNFRNILATTGDMIHGATVTDSTQLRLGAINVALVPAVKDISFAPLPGYNNPPDMFQPEIKTPFSSAASAITPGDITGYAQKGERLISQPGRLCLFKIRTSLEGIPREKYPQLKALLENLDSLTCRCIYCGREATKDVAHVSISDEGVLQVIQNASCHGCQARGWEAKSSGTFAIEIQSDVENGLPIPICTHCGGALPGASVDSEGKLVNTPNECPGCRSTEYTVVYVPVYPHKI